jgi:hypothetical protein
MLSVCLSVSLSASSTFQHVSQMNDFHETHFLNILPFEHISAPCLEMSAVSGKRFMKREVKLVKICLLGKT